MKNLIKADFKKMMYLPAYRYMILATLLLSILFGVIFLFTIEITQGKVLTELSGLEVIDITLLGMDVAAIMLIIFAAIFVAKDLASGAVHTNLAMTPIRRKYYVTKLSFIAILSTLISTALILLFLTIDQFILSINQMDALSFDFAFLAKVIGSVLIVLFYSSLSAAGAFYFQSPSGGIAFALSVMFLPALIKMLPDDVSELVLSVFPEKSLHAFIDINAANGSWTGAITVLLIWVMTACAIGFWRFRKMDY
ncbi:ABC transporter permease [Paenibacillus senegalensis]|uniref:ABC transporter permease n=1 Tax=Paenibacillus senegalensis TaxID=1465766 RepID=UPI000289126B|nr:ABC transporter permease [Paenibacillus senegalensis]